MAATLTEDLRIPQIIHAQHTLPPHQTLPHTSVKAVPHTSRTTVWGNVVDRLVGLAKDSGVLVGVGVAAVIAVAASVVVWRRQHAREEQHKRIVRCINSHFQAHETHIIQYVAKQSWNHFPPLTVHSIYHHFAQYLNDKSKGALTLPIFISLYERAGLTNLHMIHSLFAFWDTNGDHLVDFLEFMHQLNLLCFGSREDQLRSFFTCFDWDGDGRISREDLERVLHSFPHSFEKMKQHDAIQQLFKMCDADMNGKISLKEFLRLLEVPHVDYQYLFDFFKLFGVNEQLVKTLKGNA